MFSEALELRRADRAGVARRVRSRRSSTPPRWASAGANCRRPNGERCSADVRQFVLRVVVVTFPGLMILAAVLVFNLLGDGLRDVFDPEAQAHSGMA